MVALEFIWTLDIVIFSFISKILRFFLIFVRLNLINHVLALFRDKFAYNTALRNPVFRWELCKGSV